MTDADNWPGMAMIPEYARNDLDRLRDQCPVSDIQDRWA
jgi:hypothetical protein